MRSSFCDVTKRLVTVTDVSGQSTGPVFKGPFDSFKLGPTGCQCPFDSLSWDQQDVSVRLTL